MKIFSRIRKLFSKRALLAAALTGLALALPMSSLSAANVRFEMTSGIANVTAGHTTYRNSVNAKYDEVVKIQIYYHNMEDANSGKVANDVRLKINVPTAPSKNQTIRSTMSSPDIDTVSDTVGVTLDRADAYLEYIRGSAKWKHNKGTNSNVQIVQEQLSDNVVLSSQGIVLEDAKPCFNFDATVTIMARVRVPGITVDKTVRVKGQTDWKTKNTAKPGQTLEYQIAYKNMGNTTHNRVLIRDNLPPHIRYVRGTTKLKNSSGIKNVADGVTTTGILVGNYRPGAAAYVLFEAKLPAEGEVSCGTHEFRNVGVARPEGMNEFYNTATTTVDYPCDEEEPKKPLCTDIDLNKIRGRKVQATVTFNPRGATFKSATFNYGDGETFTTNQTSGNTVKSEVHKYAKDGEYTVSSSLVFTVPGEGDVTINSDQCADEVSYDSEKSTTPSKLPDTGAGDVAGIVAATTVAGALAHRYVYGRRFNG